MVVVVRVVWIRESARLTHGCCVGCAAATFANVHATAEHSSARSSLLARAPAFPFYFKFHLFSRTLIGRFSSIILLYSVQSLCTIGRLN